MFKFRVEKYLMTVSRVVVSEVMSASMTIWQMEMRRMCITVTLNSICHKIVIHCNAVFC